MAASTPNTDNLERANAAHVQGFDKGDLALPPAKKYAVVTCMDARLAPTDPGTLGIAAGDAHVIRNAGGSAREALRSLLISQHLLGTEEVVVIKHTGCGMLTFGEADVRGVIEERQGSEGAAAVEADVPAFLPFAELEEAVRDDVRFLKGHKGLARTDKVSGWVWEVETGRVRRVV